MNDQTTTPLAEIRERADAEFVTEPESCSSGLAQDLMQARVDRAALLALTEQLQRDYDEQAEELGTELAEERILTQQLQGQLDQAREETADVRAALERRLLQVKSFRRDGHKQVDPMLCSTPVTTVEDEIEDARLWWTAVNGTETNEEARTDA